MSRPTRSGRWWRAVGFAATVLVAGVALVVVATDPAVAHNTLRATAPAADAAVAATPSEIVLTFDEPAIAMGTRVVVTGPGGPVQTGPPRLVDETVRQSLQPGSPPGRYTVEWRVTSADGHPISGSFGFTSNAAGPSGPAASESAPPAVSSDQPPEAGSAGWTLLVALVVVLVVVTAAVVIRFRRSRAAGSQSSSQSRSKEKP